MRYKFILFCVLHGLQFTAFLSMLLRIFAKYSNGRGKQKIYNSYPLKKTKLITLQLHARSHTWIVGFDRDSSNKKQLWELAASLLDL